MSGAATSTQDRSIPARRCNTTPSAPPRIRIMNPHSLRCGDYLDQQIETVSVCMRRGFFDSLSTIGSRDAALGITEQLRFDQAIGERRAIDGDERAGPSAGGMGMGMAGE